MARWLLALALSAVTWIDQGGAGRLWHVASAHRGDGSAAAPFGRIQDALDAAQPGDTIVVRPGEYLEAIVTVRAGGPTAPITIRADGARGSVVLRRSGRVATLGHPHHVVDGLTFDGDYGPDDTLRISGAADDLVLRNIEVRRSSHDLIDMANPARVLIEGALLHHALNPANGRSDAHGIVAGAVRGLTIRDCEIHTFSGDGVQVDPGRAAPGWSDLVIEDTRIWLTPLTESVNGFATGIVPGENAVDTKAHRDHPRATVIVRNVIASGFARGIENMAAFNLKEHIDAQVDRVTVFDSEIAFRLRHPARVLVTNAVVHDVSTAFRYEDGIADLRIWHTTLGGSVDRAFQAASSASSRVDVRNLLTLIRPLPREADHPSNLSVTADAFVDAARHDYHLAPRSRAAGVGTPLGVPVDRDGTMRGMAGARDVGAYRATAR